MLESYEEKFRMTLGFTIRHQYQFDGEPAGGVLEKFGGKAFEADIQDSLQRLKRRAEAGYSSNVVEQS